MNKEKCLNGKCNNCEGCKARDLKQRLKDAQWDVELFLQTEGRLPNQEGDDVTKKTAKKFLELYHAGHIKDKPTLLRFAFHVFATTNLAYEP